MSEEQKKEAMYTVGNDVIDSENFDKGVYHPDPKEVFDVSMKNSMTKQSLRDELEKMYSNEFSIDNPPECFDRYESERAVRYLRRTVGGLQDNYNDRLEPTPERVATAINCIDIMGTYGKIAEPHLAALSRLDLPEEVHAHAIETLADVREDETESLSLREALARWLSP